MLPVPLDPFGCERLCVLEEERDPAAGGTPISARNARSAEIAFYDPFHLGRSCGIMGFR